MSDQEHAYSIVMRMQGLWPANLGGFERHRMREGDDLGHIDPARSHLNRRLLGTETWAQEAYSEIREMRSANHVNELEGLKKRRRTSELKRRLAEGPRDPWRATRHGPLREIILTANREWFDADLTEFFGEDGPTREEQFEELATAWLVKHFGADCVPARADLDETTYHVHAIVLPRAVPKDGRQMLQPSVRPMIRSYEQAQDDVGAWFSQIGLRRGEDRKKAMREALEHNTKRRKAQQAGEEAPGEMKEVPKHRRHASPRKWREDHDRKLTEREGALKEREAAVQEQEAAVQGQEAVVQGQEAAVQEREIAVQEQQAAVQEREAAAETRSADAEAILETAAGIADGRVEPEDLASSAIDRSEGPVEASESAPLPKQIFGRALAILRKKARQEARTELSEALAQIKAADDAIVEIAGALPRSARQKIAELRTSLSRPIIALTRKAKDWLGPEPKNPRQE